MRALRLAILPGLAALVLAGCKGESTTAPPHPASLTLVTAAPATGTAGLAVSVAPTFVVKDQFGKTMGAQPVTITVTAGGGTITGAPVSTVDGAPTPVGSWTLGQKVGTNTLTITAGSLSPLVVSIATAPGAPSKITARTGDAQRAIVGRALPIAPTVVVSDAFDNPVPRTALVIAASQGSVTAAATTDDQGLATIAGWTLGNRKGAQTLTISAGTAVAVLTAAADPDVPAGLDVTGGLNQIAKGGTPLALPVTMRLRDRFDNGIPNQAVNFAVVAGTGTLASTTATTQDDGTVIMPAWTLGRSASGQQVHASAGALFADVPATVETAFNIDVRFFGAAMTEPQRLLFTSAAARIGAIVTGKLPDVAVTSPVDLANFCGEPGLPVLGPETIGNMIIYAAVQPIDGAGKILAQAFPCAFRTGGSRLTVIGVMEFDAADLASLDAGGNLQDVITHEMLHVLGIGTFWLSNGLLVNAGTSTVAYTGPQGRQGCLDVRGTTTCAASVPVENTGGAGTVGSHWRESTFDSELMTGFANRGAMPLSLMTVGGLADLGYVTNRFAADAYTIPGGALRAAGGTSISLEAGERIGLPRFMLTPSGQVIKLDGSAPTVPLSAADEAFRQRIVQMRKAVAP